MKWVERMKRSPKNHPKLTQIHTYNSTLQELHNESLFETLFNWFSNSCIDSC